MEKHVFDISIRPGLRIRSFSFCGCSIQIGKAKLLPTEGELKNPENRPNFLNGLFALLIFGGRGSVMIEVKKY